jgi:hypothetical protein
MGQSSEFRPSESPGIYSSFPKQGDEMSGRPWRNWDCLPGVQFQYVFTARWIWWPSYQVFWIMWFPQPLSLNMEANCWAGSERTETHHQKLHTGVCLLLSSLGDPCPGLWNHATSQTSPTPQESELVDRVWKYWDLPLETAFQCLLATRLAIGLQVQILWIMRLPQLPPLDREMSC